MDYQTGYGKKKRKAIGIAEISAGSWGSLSSGLSGIGNLLSGNYSGALFNAAILAPSIYGIIKGTKRLKKGSGNKKLVSISKIKKMMKGHKSDLKKLHIRDLGLKPIRIQTILSILEKGHPQEGSGLKKKLKKSFHKSKKELKAFFRGEKSYKPSDLLGHIAMATGFSSSFLGPEMMIPSVAASLGKQYLQSKGKGKIEDKIAFMKKSIEKEKLRKEYKKSKGKGLTLPGGSLKLAGEINLPKAHKAFLQRNPKLGLNIAENIMSGSGAPIPHNIMNLGIGSKIGISTLPILGGIIGALAYQKYLKKYPKKASKLAKGNGLKLAGHGYKCPLKGEGKKKNKKRGTRKEVWDYGGNMKTSGGLYKKDLMISEKTGKIISKKMHERGKMLRKYKK